MNKETKGTLLAIATALISAIAIPVNKLFVVGLEPTVFTAVRSLLVGIGFFSIIWLMPHHDIKNIRKVRWDYLIPIGIIGGGLAFLFYFTGLKLTTAGRGAFLHKTLPLYIALLAYFFLKEKISKRHAFAMGGMFLGTLCIYYSKIPVDAIFWANPSLGDLLVIGGTILWAVENTIAKKAMIKGEHSEVVAFGRMFIGGLFLAAVLLIQGNLGAILSLSVLQWGFILISASLLFAYVTVWYYAIKLINVSKAACYLLLAPPISLLIGFLLIGEPIGLLQLVGSGIILACAYYLKDVQSEFVENF